MNDRAHRRALADVNGDKRPRFDLLGLAAFTIGVIIGVLLVSGHITITIR